MANGGAPGIDRKTFHHIEGEIGRDTFLGGIRDRLLAKRYRPQPVRRVYIPEGRRVQAPAGHSCLADTSVAQDRSCLVSSLGTD